MGQDMSEGVDTGALMDAQPQALWGLGEVAAYLAYVGDHRDPISAVRYLCRTRKLKHVKVGKHVKCRRSWVDSFLDDQAVEPVI